MDNTDRILIIKSGSCDWQVKLCDPLAIGPYLSASEMRYHD